MILILTISTVIRAKECTQLIVNSKGTSGKITEYNNPLFNSTR